jgi:hypothetical protein
MQHTGLIYDDPLRLLSSFVDDLRLLSSYRDDLRLLLLSGSPVLVLRLLQRTTFAVVEVAKHQGETEESLGAEH